jgi:hypothetical protein
LPSPEPAPLSAQKLPLEGCAPRPSLGSSTAQTCAVTVNSTLLRRTTCQPGTPVRSSGNPRVPSSALIVEGVTLAIGRPWVVSTSSRASDVPASRVRVWPVLLLARSIRVTVPRTPTRITKIAIISSTSE